MMRTAAFFLMLTLLCACADQDQTVNDAHGSDPGKRVTAFLQTYQAQGFRGLPDTRQAGALAPHLSPRLNGLLANALRGQQTYKSRFPSDKPPMVDGDIFSSLFEGATSGEVEAAVASGDRATVRVKYIHADPATSKTIHSWHDHMVLVRSGNNWLIDDVEYQGNWDFSPRGRLSAALAETAALAR